MVETALLVVEDDRVLRRSLTRAIRNRTALRWIEAGDVVTAANAVACARWRLGGAIIDVRLPDGNGLAIAEAVRRREPTAPIVVFTGCRDEEIATSCERAGAEIVFKPNGESRVLSFIEQVGNMATLERSRDLPAKERAIEVFSTRHRLSVQQRRILELLAEGVDRSALARSLAIEETTLKTHIRELLTRTGARSVDQLGWRLLGVMTELGPRA